MRDPFFRILVPAIRNEASSSCRQQCVLWICYKLIEPTNDQSWLRLVLFRTKLPKIAASAREHMAWAQKTFPTPVSLLLSSFNVSKQADIDFPPAASFPSKSPLPSLLRPFGGVLTWTKKRRGWRNFDAKAAKIGFVTWIMTCGLSSRQPRSPERRWVFFWETDSVVYFSLSWLIFSRKLIWIATWSRITVQATYNKGLWIPLQPIIRILPLISRSSNLQIIEAQ